MVVGTEVTRRDRGKLNAARERGVKGQAALAEATVDENVWHCSLSLPPEAEPLDDAKWSAIVHEFMEDMGFTDPNSAPSRWAAVRHGVTKNGGDHVHIVASRVRDDGSVVDLWRPHPDKPGRKEGDWPRAQRVCRRLEAKHGLEVLTGRDRDVPAHYDRDDQTAVTGYSVGLPATEYANRHGRPVMHGGKKLGEDLSLPRLRERWIDTAGARADARSAWAHTASSPGRVERSSDDSTATAPAEIVGTSRPTVLKWRCPYLQDGLDGLLDAERPGRPRHLNHADVVSATLRPPPRKYGVTHWSSRLLAGHLGIGNATVARARREYGVQPRRAGTFKFSTDPQLDAKVTDVVGLYLEPPENAIVLCVDEQSQIQTLDRTQYKHRCCRYSRGRSNAAPTTTNATAPLRSRRKPRITRGYDPPHHRDSGFQGQYTSVRHTEHLDLEGIAPSIGTVGDAFDNALMGA